MPENEIKQLPVPLSEDDYFDGGGVQCPVCGGFHCVKAEKDFEGERPELTQTVSCFRCGAIWQDKYSLVGYEDLRDKEGQRIW